MVPRRRGLRGGGGADRAGRSALAGMERADSLVIDPHKWLFQPYEAERSDPRAGALRAHVHLERRVPARHVRRRGQLPRPRDPAHRGTRALKLWLSVQVFGLDAFRRPSPTDRVGGARRGGAARATGLEVVTPAQLGSSASRASATTTRECRPRPSPRARRHRRRRCARPDVLRLCTINPRTTFEEIEETIERMERGRGGR